MRIVILEDASQVNSRAADIIGAVVQGNPRAVLGLATGGTPVGTYQELIDRHRRGEISFAQASSFNLDEYVGLDREHEQSYYTFMQREFFQHVDLVPERCHLPNGMAEDLSAECDKYERMIDEAGGIDLQLLGIGSDGHVAFNEPGSSLASRTRIKALTKQTRADNARFFNSIDEVPRIAITMGVGTILDAKQILLLATGAGKAAAVRAFVEGPVSAQVPASALQLHPRVTVVLDRAAADWLVRKEYYMDVEVIQCELEGRKA